MKLVVDIESNNAAMDINGTIDCVNEIARELHYGEKFGIVRDANGNTVGKWEYSE